MAEQRLSQHNVVAVHPDFDAAVAALTRLEEDGFDVAEELSVLGPEHEMRPGVARIQEAGSTAMTGVVPGALTGAAVGGAAGAGLIALTSAAVALPGIGVGLGVGATILTGAVAGATGGSTVGGLLGFDAAGRRAEVWQQTLSPLLHRVQRDGVVLVAAHVDDDARATRAEELLADTGTEVVRLEADVDYRPERAQSYLGDRYPSGAVGSPGAPQEGIRPPSDPKMQNPGH